MADSSEPTDHKPANDHLSEEEAAETLKALQEEHQFDTSTDDQDEP